MPPDKKPEGKPDAKADAKPATGGGIFDFSHPDPFVEAVWALIILFLVIFSLNAIARALFSGNILSHGFLGSILSSIINFFERIFPYVQIIAVLLSALLSYYIYNIYKKLVALRLVEAKLLYPEAQIANKNINPQWERILTHTESLNESDWRLSILEADIMLSTLLENLGLPGETMADKLKAVEKSDFTTIDQAWEGHKIRNQIAHESSFSLSQREAKRVIELFRQVFEEFRII